jgi:hypothetical protein
MQSTKKLSKGHYLHISSGLHIVYCMGERTGYWNIWEDENLTKEWSIGINTKWQAIERIENQYN